VLTSPASIVHHPEVSPCGTVVTMSAKRLDDAQFKQSWARSEPVVVTDLQQSLQGTWTPGYFIENFGSEQVTIIDCESDQEFDATVAIFFQSFGSTEDGKRMLKLKVRITCFVHSEATPFSSFRIGRPKVISDMFSLSYMQRSSAVYPSPIMCALMACVILSRISPEMVLFPILVCLSLAHLRESLNLIAGPKMYNANGSSQNHRHGSTKLHLDVTGALNLMLYAAPLPDGSRGFAVWHIFPSMATAMLRDFFRTEPAVSSRGPGDPIHNQNIYLTPELLQILADKHGVYPYVIHQHPGDAVFIPAGCAHQVGS
jgi:JmjC domain, hydroxylase